MQHLLNWVEIPATNIDRAAAFYATIFGTSAFQQMEMEGMHYAFFPTDDQHNAGALVQGEYYHPASGGVTIYLAAGPDMQPILDRIAANGGQVIMPKTYMGELAGHVAQFIDSEGNRMGLQHA